MKKFVAAIVALVMVMSLSIAALAASVPSASGDVYRKVTVINGVGANQDVKSVKDGEALTLTADSSKGTFNSWKVYKADGTAAVAGTDYTITGSLTDATLTITPKADLIVTGNYGGKITDPKTGGETTSPATGDFAVVYLGVLAIAALGLGIVSKKQLAK